MGQGHVIPRPIDCHTPLDYIDGVSVVSDPENKIQGRNSSKGFNYHCKSGITLSDASGNNKYTTDQYSCGGSGVTQITYDQAGVGYPLIKSITCGNGQTTNIYSDCIGNCKTVYNQNNSNIRGFNVKQGLPDTAPFADYLIPLEPLQPVPVTTEQGSPWMALLIVFLFLLTVIVMSIASIINPAGYRTSYGYGYGANQWNRNRSLFSINL